MRSEKLEHILTLMAREAELSEVWKFDQNTTTLLILQNNLASVLQACLVVSDNLENLENLNVVGLINGLTETLEWLVRNIEYVEKKNA